MEGITHSIEVTVQDPLFKEMIIITIEVLTITHLLTEDPLQLPIIRLLAEVEEVQEILHQGIHLEAVVLKQQHGTLLHRRAVL